MTCETCLPDQHARYFIMQHFGSPARLDGLVHSKSAGDLHQGMAATCGALAESSIPGGDGVATCRMGKDPVPVATEPVCPQSGSWEGWLLHARTVYEVW